MKIPIVKMITKKTIIKTSWVLFFAFLFVACGSTMQQTPAKEKKKPWENKAFENYLTRKNISFKKKEDGSVYNDSIGDLYGKYYSDYRKYEKKQELESNPYLKVNKVYVYYVTPTSVEFKIYSDEGTFCLNTEDLDMDGKVLSLPENGVVKVLEPIILPYYGGFRIEGNSIKTRRNQKTPYKEWYSYINGTIKNDTIHFTEKYIGTNLYKYDKKWLTKTRKENFIEVYQPNLKAKKYHVQGLPFYEVTGEFSVAK